VIEIIAEAAQGFLGAPREKTALLARFAAAAKADAVKFQLVYADELCTPDYKHYKLFGELEMPDADWLALARQCKSLGIGLYVDVFGERSLALAAKMELAGIKIHSTDMLNMVLLESAARCSVKRVILSAGGCLLPEIEKALALMKGKDVVLMHGFQGYPTATGENQIARLAELRRAFPQARLGFGDHVPETDAARLWLAAVAVGAGAQVIEKHITISSVTKEEDHESALNPDEFAAFVANIRLAHQALGESAAAPDFGMSEREQQYRKQMKKHLVARRDLAAGAVLAAQDIGMKRTSAADGVLYEVADALGRRLTVALRAGDPILRRTLR
jgi:N,N'-diacetyllegionaminate synthase